MIIALSNTPNKKKKLVMSVLFFFYKASKVILGTYVFEFIASMLCIRHETRSNKYKH